MSLRTKLMIMITTTAIMLGAVAFLLVYLERDSYKDLLIREQERIIDEVAKLVEVKFESYRADIEVLSDMASVQSVAEFNDVGSSSDVLSEEVTNAWYDRTAVTFVQFGKTREHYSQLRLLDASGKEVVRVNNLPEQGPVVVDGELLQDKSDRYYIQEIRETKPGSVYFSAIDFNTEEGEVVIPLEPTIRLGKSLYSESNNDFIGMVVVNIDANDFLDELKDHEITPNVEEFLFDDDGYYLINSSVPELEFNRVKSGFPSEYFKENKAFFENNRLGHRDKGVSGKDFFSGDTFIEFHRLISYNNNDYVVFVQRVNENIFLETSGDARIPILFSLVLLVLGLVYVIYFLFIKRLLKRIRETSDAIERISRGDLKTHIKVEGEDEVSVVGSGINKMQEELLKHENELLESQALLQKKALEFEGVNSSLESTQRAMLNILEDLKGEKEVVEKRVLNRTLELDQEKEKLSHITENMQAAAILLDTEACFVFANSQAYTIFQLEEGKGDILDSFLNMSLAVDMQEALDKCKEGETVVLSNVECNEVIYEVTQKYLVSEEKNETVHFGFLILIRDVTEERLFERSKSELVAVASHQLRTPLTAMRGNVEMLDDESFGKLNKEQRELLKDIEMSTIRLITMVNEMLDITKIEKGDLEMNLEPIEVQAVINSVLSDLSEYARRHEFTITHNTSSKDEIVFGDNVRVRQVLQNLIDNSIKYSRHPGSLSISYNHQGDMLEVVLQDDGIGIPESEQSKMFGRFYRASNTAKSTSSGSGLGLYIVKSIVEQLGGSIRFESVEDKGTTFFVALPTKDVKNKS